MKVEIVIINNMALALVLGFWTLVFDFGSVQ